MLQGESFLSRVSVRNTLRTLLPRANAKRGRLSRAYWKSSLSVCSPRLPERIAPIEPYATTRVAASFHMPEEIP